jgi:putative permease
MIKQLVIIGVAVMSTLLMAVVLWDFRVAVVYVFLSLALAATIRPLVTNWQSHRPGTRVILALIYAVAIATFMFLVFLVGKYVSGDLQQLAATFSMKDAWSLPAWLGSSSFQPTLLTWLPTPNKIFEALTGEESQLVLPAVLSFTEGIGGFITGLVLVLILSVYWSSNQVNFERLWLSLLPSEQRRLARDIWRTIELELGAYLRSEFIQSILAAMILSIGYWILGCPYPVMLGVVGALAWFIPVVGAALAMVLPLLVGLMTSLQLGILAALFTLIVLIALQLWVEPRLFQRHWDNPILTLVLILVMADVFGLVGVIIAPPLSGILRILWNSLVRDRLIFAPSVQVSDLKQRHAHLWNTIEELKEEPPLLVINSMQRLAALLEKAEPVLPELEPAGDSSKPFHPSQPVTTREDPLTSKSR